MVTSNNLSLYSPYPCVYMMSNRIDINKTVLRLINFKNLVSFRLGHAIKLKSCDVIFENILRNNFILKYSYLIFKFECLAFT